MQLIDIHIACNDPDNGLFDGRASQITLGALEAEFEAVSVTPPKFVVESDAIRISGKRWPYHRSAEWVGNWCWNSYSLSVADAGALIAWVRSRGLFHLTCGSVELADLYDRAIMPGDDRDFVSLLEKALA